MDCFTSRRNVAPDAAFGYNALDMTRRPWLRGLVWLSALLLGGLGIVVLIYSLIGGASFASAVTAIALALAAFVYMVIVLVRFQHSERTGNGRWYDRERRGF
jgi:O-antigen/teichoic acid export membrane protein